MIPTNKKAFYESVDLQQVSQMEILLFLLQTDAQTHFLVVMNEPPTVLSSALLLAY